MLSEHRYCLPIRPYFFRVSPPPPKLHSPPYWRWLLGDLQRGQQAFEWLIDEENRELVDEIEAVNMLMLDQLISGSDSLAVLFCEYTVLPQKNYPSKPTSWRPTLRQRVVDAILPLCRPNHGQKIARLSKVTRTILRFILVVPFKLNGLLHVPVLDFE